MSSSCATLAKETFSIQESIEETNIIVSNAHLIHNDEKKGVTTVEPFLKQAAIFLFKSGNGST